MELDIHTPRALAVRWPRPLLYSLVKPQNLVPPKGYTTKSINTTVARRYTMNSIPNFILLSSGRTHWPPHKCVFTKQIPCTASATESCTETSTRAAVQAASASATEPCKLRRETDQCREQCVCSCARYKRRVRPRR